MLIYLLILIPIIASLVCFFYFKKEVVWWEYLIIFGVSILCIIGSKLAIEHAQVSDTEYWGGWVTEVRYYEDWNEYIHQTCTCCCDEDGGGCMTYDCSYVDYHPERWEARDSNGKRYTISKSKYRELVRQFNTDEQFVELNRDYHTNDGDMYKCVFDGDDSRLEPTIAKHTYENRVRVSSSTYALKEPSPEIFNQYKLFHYPEIYNIYKQKAILGYDDPVAERKLQIINARMGKRYQFKSYIMIFKNQPREAGIYQEEQWQGGNKNELNIAIGIDETTKEIKWCHVFSWTDKRDLVVAVKNLVELHGKLNLPKIVDEVGSLSKQRWKRKEFEDFSYLTVEPKGYHILIAFIVTLIVNVGVVIFVVSNDVHEYRSGYRGGYRMY